MGAILMLAVSILYPVLLYKILRFIHIQKHLKLYWMIVPLCLVISISGPFLYSYIGDPDILLSLAVMLDYSVKSGLMIFLVIPSFVTAVLCTVYGYMHMNGWSVVAMSAVMLLGIAGLVFSNTLVNRLIYEPAIHWEQLTEGDFTRAGMWIYSNGAEEENRYIELNEQETGQVHSMLNRIPMSEVRETQHNDPVLIADISISLQSDHNIEIRVQYTIDRNLYIKITNKRSQKEYTIESAELQDFFIRKI